MKSKALLFATVGLLLFGGLFYFLKFKRSNMPDPNYNVATITPPGDKKVAPNLISMRSSGFEPSTLTVEKGTNVIFRNDEIIDRWPAANDHPTHKSYPEFDPKKAIKSTEVWTFVFDKVGTWKFHDHLNLSYKGTIIVVESLNNEDSSMSDN